MVPPVKLPVHQIVTANGVELQYWITAAYVCWVQRERPNVYLIVMVIGVAQPLLIIVEIVLKGKQVNLPA